MVEAGFVTVIVVGIRVVEVIVDVNVVVTPFMRVVV